MMDEIVCIDKVYDSMEAEWIKSRLEHAGIACFLKSDDGGGTMPHLTFANGIEVLVHRDNAESACKLLEKK